VAVAVAATSARALFVDLNESNEWCFLEETPKNTLVLAKWKTTASPTIHPDSLADLGITLSITDPMDYNFFTRDFALTSRFAFTTARGGEYKLCFQTNTSTWFGSAGQALKLDVSITDGAEATDYEELARSEHLSALELSIRKLNDRVGSIRAEQDYQRRREHKFRNTSETTNSRVLWWSLFQVTILVGTGVVQSWSLKKFFKQRKLV